MWCDTLTESRLSMMQKGSTSISVSSVPALCNQLHQEQWMARSVDAVTDRIVAVSYD